ncbi:uncharacterized protein DS421_19g652110 [Arachis hypogaea]|uniref:Uncharacterized protein n=1 Tax=Arachis hypogaea TaxID=3818 RepID=A0A6B9V9K5_ARAHY|nr:uncharacterized protein DS421_19g652110 [Arachis hypogaea]
MSSLLSPSSFYVNVVARRLPLIILPLLVVVSFFSHYRSYAHSFVADHHIAVQISRCSSPCRSFLTVASSGLATSSAHHSFVTDHHINDQISRCLSLGHSFLTAASSGNFFSNNNNSPPVKLTGI